MSKLETDAIEPSTGTTLAIGAAGDTVNLSNATVNLPAAAVTTHVTALDNAIRNDIATLALHSAIADNKAAHNLSNSFIDQFESDAGIDAETQTDRAASEWVGSITEADGTPAYDSGDRTSTITVTTDAGTQRSVTGIVDGSTTAGDSFYFDAGQSGKYLRFQFDATKKITGVKVTNDENDTSNQGNWKWQGSDNGSSWTDIGSSFAFTNNSLVGGAGGYTLWGDTMSGNTTSYVYYQALQISGTTSSSSNWMEINFLITPVTGSTNATGNFTSATQTALASVSSMGIVVLYKNNAGTASLNTDIVAEVSANGGTNYANATLVAGGTFSTGINIAAVSGVAVTAGTTPKYRISFANQASGSKETQVHGVALLY